MAKKSVDASLAAYASKGMKAPRPAGYSKELDPSKAPQHSGAKHKDPAYAGEMDQSKAPSHMKKALPLQDAPEGVKGVNEGSSMDVMAAYENPLKK